MRREDGFFLPQTLIDKFIYHYRVQEEGTSRKKNQIGSFRFDKSFVAFFNLIRDEKTHYLVPQAITVPAPQFAVISIAFVIDNVYWKFEFLKEVWHIFSLFSAESPLILTNITKAKLKSKL